MTNSDSGTKLNPGDRVRVRHDTTHDGDFSARQRTDRAAMNGKEGAIRERAIGVFGVEDVPGGPRAWFEADELEPIVTDPDGCEVGARTSLDVLDAAVQQALAAARREAQGWHSAALLARGEAEGAWAHVRSVEAGLDALRGKLGAAEAKLVQTTTERQAWRNEALREQGERKAAEAALAAERSIHETAAIGADKLAKRLADAGAAWGKMRAFLLALPRPLGAAGIEGVDAVDKALGGVAVAKVAGPWRWLTSPKCWARAAGDGRNVAIVFGAEAPPEMVGWQARGADGEWVHGAEPSQGAADRALLAAGWTLENPTGGTGDALPRKAKPWTLTGDLDQRVAEVEARLGRLESGK